MEEIFFFMLFVKGRDNNDNGFEEHKDEGKKGAGSGERKKG